MNPENYGISVTNEIKYYFLKKFKKINPQDPALSTFSL